VALLIELPLDDHEGLSAACEPSGLRIVSWEHLAEEVGKIRHPLVGWRVGTCCLFQLELHDLVVGKGRRLASLRVRGKRFGPSLLRLLIADRGFVLITSKDAERDGLAARRHFCQHVNCFVEPSWDVVKFEIVKLVLQPTDLLAICSHYGAEAA
jgi:hypothetical protein